MKKHIASISGASVIVLLGLSAVVVFAQNTNGSITGSTTTTNVSATTASTIKGSDGNQGDDDKKKEHASHARDTEDEDVGEMNKEEEREQTENALHDYFFKLPEVKSSIVIPTVDATKINTYADVVAALVQYQNVVMNIKSQSSVLDVASSSLSVQERAILLKFMNKDSFELSRTNARADEVLRQIKELIDILGPLGTQPISTEFNIKNLLLSQLQDLSSTIGDLADLADETVNIIDEETN